MLHYHRLKYRPRRYKENTEEVKIIIPRPHCQCGKIGVKLLVDKWYCLTCVRRLVEKTI